MRSPALFGAGAGAGAGNEDRAGTEDRGPRRSRSRGPRRHRRASETPPPRRPSAANRPDRTRPPGSPLRATAPAREGAPQGPHGGGSSACRPLKVGTSTPCWPAEPQGRAPDASGKRLVPTRPSVRSCLGYALVRRVRAPRGLPRAERCCRSRRRARRKTHWWPGCVTSSPVHATTAVPSR